MRRRSFIAGAAGALALPAIARAKGSTTVLKFVPQADLASLDPVWTTSYQTRDHGFLVYDTLFGTDADYKVQPQMLEGFTTGRNGLEWRLVLRDNLKFHDGSKVLATDCVASIARWAKRDGLGQALAAATDEMLAADDRTIVIRLKRPFSLLPDALGKTAPLMCPMMPAHIAQTDAFSQIKETIGSGPFRFRPAERVAGSLVVYERNPDYVPRAGAASRTAGGKIAHFERIEWHVLPDPSTVAAALQRGEVDWWDAPVADLIPMMKKAPGVTAQMVVTTGSIGTMRFNQLHPPFDNPAIRRAIVHAVLQSDYMSAVVGDDPTLWRDKVGYFPPGTPMANDAGMANLTGPRDLAKVKQELAAAGYKGEKLVLLAPQDIESVKALADISADLFKRIGLNVDVQAMDWATLVQRRVKMDSPDQGGWSVFHTFWSGLDQFSPAANVYLRGNGKDAQPGWPTSPKLEALREAWLGAPDLATQKKLCVDIQRQAFRDVPYVPLGQTLLPALHRSDLTGILDGLPLFWNVRRV